MRRLGPKSEAAEGLSSSIDSEDWGDEDVDYVSIILYGDCGVGKTCLRNRWVEGHFTGDVAPTLGVDFNKKELLWTPRPVAGPQNVSPEELPAGKPKLRKVKMKIFDMTGENGFLRTNSKYLQGFEGIVYVYDVMNKNTLQSLEEMIMGAEMQAAASGRLGQTVSALVGNKADVPANERQVSIDTGKEASMRLGIPAFEASAKTGEGVEELFMSVASAIMDQRQRHIDSGYDVKRSKSDRQSKVGSLRALVRKASAKILGLDPHLQAGHSLLANITKGVTSTGRKPLYDENEIEPLVAVEAPVADTALQIHRNFKPQVKPNGLKAVGDVSPCHVREGRSLKAGGNSLIRSPARASRSPMASQSLRSTSEDLLSDWGMKNSRPRPQRSRPTSPGPGTMQFRTSS